MSWLAALASVPLAIVALFVAGAMRVAGAADELAARSRMKLLRDQDSADAEPVGDLPNLSPLWIDELLNQGRN